MSSPTAPAATTTARIATNTHFAALGLWIGALVLSGASAAIIFPTMKSLAPALPAYAAYTGDHWKLAAGMAQAKVFLVADIVSSIAALIACISLIVAWMRSHWSGILPKIRTFAIIIACAALGYQFFILGPIMTQNIRQHWTLAAAGNNVEAEKYRVAFEADHPKASMLLYTQFGTVFAALVLGLAQRNKTAE